MKAVILSGGKSLRMGSPKALLPFRNLSMLEHTRRMLVPHFEEVCLSVNDPKIPCDNLKRISDVFAGQGPMSGIHAAMKLFPQEKQLFFISIDTPLLTIESLLLLTNHADKKITCFCSPEQLYPLPAVFSTSCYPDFSELLKERKSSLREYIKLNKSTCAFIKTDTKLEKQLGGCNTPEEYNALCHEDDIH